MKYFFRTIFILSLALLLPHTVHAAVVGLVHTPTSVAQQEQFYVDVTIDPQNTSLNAVQGTVVFSDDTLSFVRAETGSSAISFFIDPPTLKGNTITFSGIIPGGFNGLINPFDPQHKTPGEIVRLVFVGKAAGEAQIIATGMSVAHNDGQGTIEIVPDQKAFLSVSTAVSVSIYTPHGTQPPLLSAFIVSDKELYDGKNTLIFNAVDKQSGIDHVEVKEGNSDWQTVESPYVLHDQSRSGILLVRAVDGAGNKTLVTINAAPHTAPIVLIVIIGLLLLCIVLYVIKKKYSHHLDF